MRLNFGILALLLTPPGLPSGGFHWQRTITPPAGASTAQACILLDAATFANAAPALRDLRLFQDGLELPYAVEESYDPRALESGITPADDRSLYEPVTSATLQPRTMASVVRFTGDGTEKSPPRLTAAELQHAHHDLYAVLQLPAHVPVERVRLVPAPAATVALHLRATQGSASSARDVFVLEHGTSPSEAVSVILDGNRPFAPVTLGANLQRAATVTAVLDEASATPRTLVLEMRRRSLCYQPRSANPLTLYLGGGAGMAAKTYSYASSFSTAVDRPYATLGPLLPNPDDALEGNRQPDEAKRRRMLWAAALAAVFFVFSATRMLRSAKRF